MTKNARDKLIEYIDKAYSDLSMEFDVSNKNIEDDGVVTDVSFNVGSGMVEFLYAPPEFHVEVFVSVNNGDGVLTRYDLAKLMTNDVVRNWVVGNRPDMSHGDKAKAEVDWFVLLLRKLKTEPEFLSLIS